jgi:dephospho-CoA kinase
MFKVAVTGGIGSGKSLVCKVFEKLGIPVFYADKAAKELMNSNKSVCEKLISYFGREIYDAEGKILRDKFAEIIFNDQTSLLKVNEIVHPAVRNEFNNWVKKQNAPYVIEEAAIVFETGQTHHFDWIITVTASLELKIKRVMKRDNISREKVLERMKNQETDQTKNEKADFIIVNDDKELILPQIISIHNKLF